MSLNFLKTSRRTALHAAVLAALVAGATGQGPARAQMNGGAHGMHGHGAAGGGHDEVNMPGLKGLNATPEESAELAVLFRGFETIARAVAILPDGIRTTTRSSDDAVMAALVSHVTGMIGRVARGDDPQIMIQSPTLDIFFARGDAIVTGIEMTEDGIVVTQTSEDPRIVEALHLHAAEVTAMADRGMQAVHEMMMTRARR